MTVLFNDNKSKKQSLLLFFPHVIFIFLSSIFILFLFIGQMRSAIRSSSMKEKRGGGSHHKVQRGRQHRESRMKKSQSSPTQLAQASTSDEDGEEEAALTSLHSLSIQLLDLMHTLHTRAASIFAAWAQEDGQNGEEASGNLNPHIDAATGTLWATCWCPLLQGENDHIKHPSPLSRQPSLLLALVHHTDTYR